MKVLGYAMRVSDGDYLRLDDYSGEWYLCSIIHADLMDDPEDWENERVDEMYLTPDTKIVRVLRTAEEVQ